MFGLAGATPRLVRQNPSRHAPSEHLQSLRSKPSALCCLFDLGKERGRRIETLAPSPQACQEFVSTPARGLGKELGNIQWALGPGLSPAGPRPHPGNTTWHRRFLHFQPMSLISDFVGSFVDSPNSFNCMDLLLCRTTSRGDARRPVRMRASFQPLRPQPGAQHLTVSLARPSYHPQREARKRSSDFLFILF